MAAKSLEIHPAALAEWKDTVVWYLARNETAAREFAAEVDRLTEQIARFPHRWPVAEHGTRRLVMRRFPFAIVYREKDGLVQVLTLAHGHRRPGYWKDRL